MSNDPFATMRPSESEIRAYAHALYVRSGWLSGRDLENWLEAEAALMARGNPSSPLQSHSLHIRRRRHQTAHAEKGGP